MDQANSPPPMRAPLLNEWSKMNQVLAFNDAERADDSAACAAIFRLEEDRATNINLVVYAPEPRKEVSL